ncbi:hypothetical protein [Microbacterium sp.]|uniref:hypothetical protein n=1 Tax=Microbacterium sp. TaxID=51671 RepID=UPI003569AE48
MSESSVPAVARIPNIETDSAPEDFREGPTAAINAAVKASATVKLVLNGAQIALGARADKFTQDVGVRAVEVASERGAIAVDVPDVAKAAEALFPAQTNPNSPWQWGVLGIVAGAVLSFLVTVLVPAIPSEAKALAVVVALVLAAGCVIWSLVLILPRKPK